MDQVQRQNCQGMLLSHSKQKSNISDYIIAICLRWKLGKSEDKGVISIKEVISRN